MMNAIKNLFSSKKFVVMLAAIIGYIAARFGWDVPLADAERIIGVAAAYLIGQGIADHGKESAKLNAL